MKKHKIGIIGAGFVGTAVETGLQQVADIRIYDRFKDTENLLSVVENSDILFVCVPTPMLEDGACDISIVEEVAKNINIAAETRKIVIIKSTVIPGTTEELASCYSGHAWIFNPEFLREATFIEDFLQQDRIILGITSGCSTEDVIKVLELYKDFTETQIKPAPIIEIKSEVAEMTKYTINSFLATKLSFFNEIYEICEAANIDYNKLLEVVLLDKRIGKSHYKVPGLDGQKSFGGKCLPKDINGLMSFAKDLGIDPLVLESVWAKNLIVREVHDWDFLPQVTGKYENEE